MTESSVTATTGRFVRALRHEPLDVPPIWLMRQAGRYQASYQRLRERYSFESLCREPELAAEAALAPIREFGFDAAILFSDLLFPLEALGFGLSYDEGPPKLDGSLTAERVAAFRPLEDAVARLAFQREAMRVTRERLPADTGLIGFVGGPWTLFVYAVEGTHAGALARAKAAPGLYRAFAERMTPLLIENIGLQFEGGADVVMVLDTAAGELAPDAFGSGTGADLAALASAFPGRLGYYAKGAVHAHLVQPVFAAAPWAGFGLDWRWNLADALAANREGRFVQGNFDPARLRASGAELAGSLETFLHPLRGLDAEARRGWICGLGHGVLPGTPESSVRAFVETVRETFV